MHEKLMIMYGIFLIAVGTFCVLKFSHFAGMKHQQDKTIEKITRKLSR